MYRLVLPALLAAACVPGTASAETNDCTPIVSLPATVTSQGIYCLTGDLSTAITSGSAIELANNNITLDCNGFKIGGLAGGPSTQAAGIRSLNRSNITIRNCNIRGFLLGIALEANGGETETAYGQIVEDNRLDGITGRAIFMNAEGSVIRRNTIIDTGGNPYSFAATGILVLGTTDVIDNVVDGAVEPSNAPDVSNGIWIEHSAGSVIAGNRVRNLSGAGTRAFVNVGPGDVVFRDNFASTSSTGSSDVGFLCASDVESLTVGNASVGFSTAYSMCVNGGGNTQLLP